MAVNKNLRVSLHWLKTSIWAFPAILILLLIILTTLKISGTSVGVYHQALYGANISDPDLLYGKPQAIRSDEWLSNTQMVVSQSKQGFPRFNKDFGSGRDVTLEPNLPNKDWSTLFRPHNWSFFVLPLENAFAFKWWLLMVLLMISCYFFILRVLPDQRLVAILFSVAIGLSPFELWWYQTGAFLCVAYGFFMLILGMRIINKEKIPFVKLRYGSDIIHVLTLAFVIACFGLLIYPPFQIPVAIGVAFFMTGYIIDKYSDKHMSWHRLVRRVGISLISVVIAGLIIVAFLLTRQGVIKSFNDTLYPGARTISSGDLNGLKVFDGFLMPQLQSGSHGNHFLGNQSEDSNFILLMPFLLLPGFFIILYAYYKKHKINWTLLMIQLGSLLFLARAFIHFGNGFYKIFLLQKVPNERLLIGMGFIGILQIVYIFKELPKLKPLGRKLDALIIAYGLACFGILTAIGFYVIKHYPLFIHRRLEVLLFAAMFTGIIVLILKDQRILAAMLLLLFTLGSSFNIMPLYRGLGFDGHSLLGTHMETVSKPNDTWATVDIPLFQNMGLLAGRRSLTGTQLYPDTNFWRQVGGMQNDKVFNREGHIILVDNPKMSEPASLLQRNFINLKLQCSDFILKSVNYALSTHPINYPCVKLVGNVTYPQINFYLYKISQ